MKKVLLTILLLISTPAFAAPVVLPLKPASTTINNYVTNVVNNVDDKDPIQAGIGMDIKLYKFDKVKFLDSINFEVRKDLMNIERNSFYLVAQIDLTKKGE